MALEPQLVLAPPSFLRADLLGQIGTAQNSHLCARIENGGRHFRAYSIVRKNGWPSARGQCLYGGYAQAGRQSHKKVEGRPRPTLLYVFNSEPLITVGPGSFIHHLIELAGGRNAAERANAPYPRLTMEEVLTQNPEILLFPIGEFEGIPQAEQDRWKRWDTLRASRGKIISGSK